MRPVAMEASRRAFACRTRFVANDSRLQILNRLAAISYKRQSGRYSIFVARGTNTKVATMTVVERNDRLRIDLAAARRAHTLITDPLSLQTLNDYIIELEEELHRDAASFLLHPQAVESELAPA
ncbi:hypothetical protein [uncultured Sphingomonas sp.]|uniref:hypothetical protein n=1 Tax=uncultured Sphingomonas sp. TaxID=158754 RepID=UPI00374A8625